MADAPANRLAIPGTQRLLQNAIANDSARFPHEALEHLEFDWRQLKQATQVTNFVGTEIHFQPRNAQYEARLRLILDLPRRQRIPPVPDHQALTSRLNNHPMKFLPKRCKMYVERIEGAFSDTEAKHFAELTSTQTLSFVQHQDPKKTILSRS